MAKYFVDIVMSALVRVEVKASDEEEAHILAIEEVDPYVVDDCDWDYKIDSIEKEDEDEENE